MAVFDSENVFKKIVDGVIPCHKIFETEDVIAILDAFPVASGHALLIPKASGYANIEDLPTDLAAKVFAELPRLAKAVRAATKADGVNIISNNGAAAGQAVFHLHIHVIPRFDGDGLIGWPRSLGPLAAPDAVALLEVLKQNL